MGFLQALHVYDDRESKSAAMNMAVDEALLELVTVPSLRFYTWQRPSLSFGYFGFFGEVGEEAAHRDTVRRWTGGGTVLHGSDFTYSFILPVDRTRHLPASRIIYSEVHEAIRQALSPYRRVELALRDALKSSDDCFANPVRADVLEGETKIAGAAQRRTRVGLLHQGSIQHIALPDSFAEAFARELCPHFTWRQFPPELPQRAHDLSAEKYGTAAWLRQR